LQLLEKLMLLGYQDQWSVSGAQWFYAAVHDVDGITLDIYWNLFVCCRDMWGLVLSITSLILLTIYQQSNTGERFQFIQVLPVLGFSILVPISIVFIFRRTKTTARHVLLRKKGESAWMEVFSWLAHSNRIMYGFSPHELTEIEKHFKGTVNKFMKHHQAARDYMNDSTWVTYWLSHISYCLILLWGAFALYSSRVPGVHAVDMTEGEFVLLSKLFFSIGKYIGRLNLGLVNFLRGEVSLTQVESLLNIKGRDRFAEADKLQARNECKEHQVPSDSIEISHAKFTPDKLQGVGPFGKLSLSSKVSFPLGSLVIVAGTDEAARLSFLAAIAGVISPEEGQVDVPLVAERVMVPPMPFSLAGQLTVAEAFALAGASLSDAQRLAHIFGLDPDQGSEHLPPGSMQLLAVGRALLHDPEVLVLPRPMAYVPAPTRTRIACLLRLWQGCGGVNSLLEYLRGHEETEDVMSSSDSIDIKQEISKHKPNGHQWVPLRTLVLCEEDIPPAVRSQQDTFINLDDLTSDEGLRNHPLLKDTVQKNGLDAPQNGEPCCAKSRNYGPNLMPRPTSTPRSVNSSSGTEEETQSSIIRVQESPGSCGERYMLRKQIRI
jgi:hypothetical protein